MKTISMKPISVFFLALMVLNGCSPLDRYLGFTPIEGPKPVFTQLQKTRAHSSQNAGNSSGASAKPAPPSALLQPDTGGNPDGTAIIF